MRELIYRRTLARTRNLLVELKNLPCDRFPKARSNLECTLDFVLTYLPRWHSNPRALLFRTAVRLVAGAEKDIFVLKNRFDPFKERKGLHLRTYISDVDGALQTYSVWVPLEYGGSPYPLIVWLHGYQRRNSPYQCQVPPEIEGAIVVSPSARGSYDYKYLSEVEVLNTIEDIKKHYSIDPDRIYLMGHSMGGTGAWSLAVHYPHLFSAVSPSSGNTDHRIWEERWEAPLERTPRSSLRAFLEDADSSVTYAPNLRNIPVLCLHGTKDDIVDVEHSRRMVRALTEFSSMVAYEELPRGHRLSEIERKGRWLLRHRRRRYPAQVSLKCSRLRYSRAYWLGIDAFENPLEFAYAEAELSEGTIFLTFRNVSAFTLHELDKLVKGEMRVVVNGRTVWSGESRKSLSLERSDHEWRERKPDNSPRKKPGLEGPIADAFLSPFLIVRGTQDSSVRGQMLAREVEYFSESWKERYGARPRLKDDTELTDADIKSYNLILYGGPGENLITRRIIGKVPCTITRDAIEIFGRRFTGEDIGLRLCYPNPLNPERYVVLNCALSGQGYFLQDFRFGNWFDWKAFESRPYFDYIVYDSRSYNPETILFFGYFDSRWKFDPRFAFEGAREYRDRVEVLKCPKIVKLEGGAMELADLLPLSIALCSGSVYFGGIDADGRRLPEKDGATPKNSILVRPYARLSYQLDGRFSRFRALVSVLPRDGGDSKYNKLRVRVLGDGQELAETPPIGEGEEIELEAPLSAVKKFSIEIIPSSKREWFVGYCVLRDPMLQ